MMACSSLGVRINVVGEAGERKMGLRVCQVIVYSLFILTILLLTLLASSDKLYRHDYVKGAVTTQVMGALYAKAADHSGNNRTWDVTDVVIPPRGTDEFVVLTHIRPPLTQRQGVCDELPTLKGIRCTTDLDCVKGTVWPGSTGLMTGKCVPSSFEVGVKVCEISGWCPVQLTHKERADATELYDTKDWIVYIKNDIQFPKFNRHWGNRRHVNTSDEMTEMEALTCVYDQGTNRFCPIFKLQTLVEWAKTSYESLVKTGGVIQIVISWDCEMKYLNDCAPSYTVRRTDQIHPGYQIRNHIDQPDKSRILYQANGIRFLVTVEGWGKEYSYPNLCLTFGSYFAYISAVSFFLYNVIYWCCGFSIMDTYQESTTFMDLKNSCLNTCSRCPRRAYMTIRGNEQGEALIIM